MHKITLTLMFLFGVLIMNAQTATLKGTISDPEMNETLIGVNVLIEGTEGGTVTDWEGNYEFTDLEPGTYTIVCSYISFATLKTENVELKAGETVVLNLDMKESSTDLAEIVIKAKANKENTAILLLDRKKATTLTQNIGAKELSKKGASNVADGLKKVAGLSVVGSKFVFVRGMGDRYNNASLNNLPVVSPDPDRKVIPMSIFPTDIVKNITVIKAFSPELYGDFSGGSIDIRTKDYPETKTLKFGMGTGYNSNLIVGAPLKTYSDKLGLFSNASTQLSNDIFNGQAINNATFGENLNPSLLASRPAYSANVLAGNLIQLNGEKEFGYLISTGYDNQLAYENGNYRQINKQGDVKLDYDYEKYNQTANFSTLANMHFRINPRSTFRYNMVHSSQIDNELRETNGSHFDYNNSIFTRRFTSTIDQVTLNQFSGEHKLKADEQLVINWAGSYGFTKSLEPDRRQLVYLYDENSPSGAYQFNHIDRLDNHRFFSTLNEKELAAKLDIKYHFAENFSLQTGIQNKHKTRGFDYKQYIYDLSLFSKSFPNGTDANLPDNFINEAMLAEGAVELEEVLNPSSEYNANLDIQSAYVNTDWNIKPNIKLQTGVRVENSVQKIEYRDQQQPLYLRENSLKSVSVLPAVSLKWNLTDDQILWVNTSKTLSRPGFKEVAPFEYTEVFAGMKTIGNPELNNGQNYNLDLRYELYSNPGEIIAVSAFGKYLNNPIEQTRLATASGQLQSYQNANYAYLGGLELEMIKKLNTLFPETKFIRNLSIGVNASYLYSRVNIGDSDGTSTIQTNDKRALQGASPYLVNADLSYDLNLENVRTTATLAYNVFGKRIYATGIQGLGDIYENPVNTLNFTLQNKFTNGLGINFSAKNILNPLQEFTQDSDAGTSTLNTSRRGVTFGLGINYNF